MMRADLIAAPLAGLRNRDTAGTVLASFERSAYLDLDGRVIAAASRELDPGPLTIGLSEFSAVGTLSPGERVVLRDGILGIGRSEVDLGCARVWDPALPPLPEDLAPDAALVAMNGVREAVVDELRAHGSESGVTARSAAAGGGLLEALACGLDAIAAFLSGESSSGATAHAVVVQIAGRGPGLTPSGDDLLTGIVHAVTLWPKLADAAGGASRVRDLLVSAAVPHTTRISAAYLEAARQGWASEPWHALVAGIGQGPDAVRAAAQRLLGIGETSGADALTGFCWAWRRVAA
ncbi:MAG: DUF2877 domain-containing protein [bacterium]|nr:DUF2877 domain-containing protein [bacterium]